MTRVCAQCDQPQPPISTPAWFRVLLRDEQTPPVVCPSCRALTAAREAALALEVRLQRAGVPDCYRGYRWEDVAVQGEDEADWPFEQRVRDYNGKVIGARRDSLEALRGVAGWRPHHGWGYLEGQPGSGKTLAVSTVAQDLLGEPLGFEVQGADGEWRSGVEAERAAPRGALRRTTGGWAVVIIAEGDVFASQRQDRGREKGQPSTMQRLQGAGVLIWDDLGTALEDGSGWRREYVEELIDNRYKRRAPMLFTSNHTLAGLASILGERAAGRVVEMVGGRRWVLEGGWR